MNTKLIREFKTEFDWWLEDPENRKVMVKVSGEWDSSEDLVHGPFAWPLPELITAIVKNDEYAEFRMAEADGETIQCKRPISSKVTGWVEANTSCMSGGVDCYRIKPSWKWQDEISESKPVLCKVWDDDGRFTESKPCAQFITNYNQSNTLPYINNHKNSWQHAEPITIKDLHPFQRKFLFTVDEIAKLHNGSYEACGGTAIDVNPVMAKHLHPFQCKGFVKAADVIEKIKYLPNWGNAERVIDWLEKQ